MQLRYMLGMRNKGHSYVVGTASFPDRVQSRAASCPLDYDVECNRCAISQSHMCVWVWQTSRFTSDFDMKSYLDHPVHTPYVSTRVYQRESGIATQQMTTSAEGKDYVTNVILVHHVHVNVNT